MPGLTTQTYFIAWTCNTAQGSQLITAATPQEAWTAIRATLRETYHTEPTITAFNNVRDDAMQQDIRELLCGIIDAIGSAVV